MSQIETWHWTFKEKERCHFATILPHLGEDDRKCVIALSRTKQSWSVSKSAGAGACDFGGQAARATPGGQAQPTLPGDGPCRALLLWAGAEICRPGVGVNFPLGNWAVCEASMGQSTWPWHWPASQGQPRRRDVWGRCCQRPGEENPLCPAPNAAPGERERRRKKAWRTWSASMTRWPA